MKTHILGFPRIGSNRELKRSQEAFWKGAASAEDLENCARELRLRHWNIQRAAGLNVVSTGDFSLYDHVLDTTAMLGAVPPRFGAFGESVGLETYFRMARGDASTGVAAMEMTKWFDTNYHYIVPEFSEETSFAYASSKLVDETREALDAGFVPKPVLLGPLTYLALGKEVDDSNRWDHLEAILPIYESVLKELGELVDCIQIDEPVFSVDLPAAAGSAALAVYERLKKAAGGAEIMLATYFGALQDNMACVAKLPVDVLHIDLVRGAGQLKTAQALWPADKALSLGVVDGRNIWKTDAKQALAKIRPVLEGRGEDQLWIGSSCSLLHSPVDLEQETQMEPKLRDWMAFAVQKCAEISGLRDALADGGSPIWLARNATSLTERRNDPRTRREKVRRHVESISPAMKERKAPFAERKAAQGEWLELPLFPTTTIGSFPQTVEIRRARRAFRDGTLDEKDYRKRMAQEVLAVVRKQEELELDVLVHGEPERNDMVEYFGQQLDGFCFTENGWVQSYGSRCVKPPIIYGDVSRPQPMTVQWASYAQSLTKKPMKGMLTGPVTILCWSFVRDDLPRSEVCRQIALAIRDEVVDLEAAGIGIIQIDEAALREGMPLREADRQGYLDWAVECFRITASSVANRTQIHTHMCYSEFNVIAEAIAAMDADVISIEASRSRMELLDAFRQFAYPNDIGPGIWDIHSPRVPSEEEIFELLQKARQVIPDKRLWINPDCGLKTRAWPETLASLQNMVAVAKRLREE